MPARSHRKLAVALALACACDTGNSVAITVTLPEAIAARYSPEQRGLLFVALSTGDESVVHTEVICGEKTRFEVDLGTDGERKDALISAWIVTDGPGACGPDAPSGIDPDDYSLVGDEPEDKLELAGASGCNNNSTFAELILADP